MGDNFDMHCYESIFVVFKDYDVEEHCDIQA